MLVISEDFVCREVIAHRKSRYAVRDFQQAFHADGTSALRRQAIQPLAKGLLNGNSYRLACFFCQQAGEAFGLGIGNC